jgi:Tfp pilus assembly protein PilF/TolB-like protein
VTPERWRRINDLFEAVRTLPRAERPAWLERSCADDSDLQAEIERLIRADERAGDFLEPPPASMARDAFVDSGSAPGIRFGPYRVLPPRPVTTAARDHMPEVWGHLLVLARVGRGAFGEVFRAWDTRLDREVALKLLPADGSDARAPATSIIDEGRLLARVRHPNVATIYGADRIGDRVGLWMELVNGRTLEEILQTGKVFSPAEAVGIGIELCRAMSAVHRAGLLHRDIKAQNVMIAEDGRVVLMDFGTGCDPNDGSPVTLAGTPLYLAPEVLYGRDATVQSDIYSAGVLMYHILTGLYPVEATSLSRLREGHQRRECRSVRSARPDLPSKLVAVVDRAIDPQSERRYQSADALAEALAAVQARPRMARFVYYAAMAGALMLVAWIVWEVGDQRRTHQNPTGVTITAGSSRSADGSARVATSPPSVAVLPFKALGATPADEQLTIGMTEAAINRLSRIKALRVEPLARVRRYQALDQDPLAAGRALGADVVLEAHFQVSDSVVHVRWRLLRTVDGTALAADEWREPFGGILTVQSRLAESLADALQLTLTPADRTGLRKHDTTSSEAFRHYMFGRYHLEVRAGNRMRQAEREFREALKLDPQFARAHAALALTLAHLTWLTGERGIDIMPEAKDAALKALAIDESVALAHSALGHIYDKFEYDPVRSQSEHLRAMALDDQDPWVLREYGTFLMSRGAFDEALEVNQRALELDPTSTLSIRFHAMMLYAARRYDECTAECQKALTLDPNDSSLVYNWLPRCLEAQGKRDEAVDVYEQGREVRGNREAAEKLKAVYAARGWEAYWRERLRLDDRTRITSSAFANLRLGHTDEVIEILERMYETRVPWVTYTNFPEWDPVRSDPRFQSIRARAGLTDEVNVTLAAARQAARGR